MLNKHAPKKQKSLRGNHSPFMTKELSKAIMNRSRLENKFLNCQTEESKNAYNKQQNFCVSLFRKTKKDYYNNLNIKNVCDNRTFWKTVKPSLSDKINKSGKIILREGDEYISSENDVSEIMNDFFVNIVS